MDSNRVGRKARVIEILLSVVASAVGSALLVAWTLSATLSEFNQKINANGGRLTALEARDLNQITQLAAQGQANGEILRRLERIEDKLDGTDTPRHR